MGIVALGGCELGNGSEPNCSEATIESLRDRILALLDERVVLNQALANAESDLERDIIAAQIDLNQERVRAAEVALDACDGPLPN